MKVLKLDRLKPTTLQGVLTYMLVGIGAGVVLLTPTEYASMGLYFWAFVGMAGLMSTIYYLDWKRKQAAA